MKRFLPFAVALLLCITGTQAQNVFNVNDPITRYDAAQPLGSLQHPNPAVTGLQKWVSTPTSGVSVGTGSIDVSSFKQYFLNYNGTPMAFRLKFPKSFTKAESAAKKYPIMMFLHGAGEVGCPTNNGVYNNEKQLALGGGLFRDFVDQNLFDGFLLYPQLVNEEGCWGAWGETKTANFTVLIAIIDSLAKYVRADIDRVMVNGLSGGGYGAWRIADLYPQRIAKIIPSAAAGNVTNRNNFVHIPIWFATGGKDSDPTPAQAQFAYNKMKEIGADIRYTLYPDLGHSVWYTHWREPDYAAAMNDIHKANPLVFFQHNAFCENETINARLGITQGFYAYEWQRDDQTIATRTNGVNTIVRPEYVATYTGNEITVKAFGTYRVRFKRTSTSDWSAYSPKPVEVKLKTVTITPPIEVSGLNSSVLPSLDGKTTVPLQLPAGFLNYEWYRVSDNALVANTQVYNAPVGVYKARLSEEFGCGTEFSPNFTVVDATGSPKPEAPTKLVATAVSQNSIRLVWTEAGGETGYEVYRGAASGGPYKFVGLTAVNAVEFIDTGLVANTPYYYVLRAVNNTGASEKSNENTAKTLADNSYPTAPSNLEYRGSTLTSVQLQWKAGADNGGIRRYDIYANGVKMFSTTATSFNVTHLDSLKSYTFTVRAVDNSENASPPSNQVTAFTHRQGINYKYYTTTSNWGAVPDLNYLKPLTTGVTDSVNVNNTAINPATEKFEFLWQGWIYIPVSATYTFETRSDDGSKLFIDAPYSYKGVPVVNNDGVHGIKSVTGNITLTQGYHSIAIAYFQRANGFGMEVYWKNNVGLARERIPKNFFSSANGPTAVAPAVPTGISATAISYNQIEINWTDNNTNESGYEIVRATSGGGTYVPVGTVAANATSFTDSGLIWTKAYYYKLRTIAEGGESGYSSYVTATTLARPTYTPAPSPLTAFAGPNNSISLNWQDNAINEWNYRIYRSTDNIKFPVIAALKGNTNAYTDENVVAQKVYYYYVLGYNAVGLGPKTNVVRIKAGNNAPVIGALDDVFAKTGQSVNEPFTVTDDAGDTVTVEIVNKPAFLSVNKVNETDFQVTADPTNDNVGQYTITVRATDNWGAASTATFMVTVGDSKTRAVFVNFGAAGKTAKAPWNNWNGTRTAGDVIASLKDESNTVTPFSITTVNGWTGTTTMGHLTGNDSGIVPDSALESGLADNGSPKQLSIGGLNPSKRYNLHFIGSQNEGLVATAQYAAGTQTAVLDARYNTMKSANLNGLTPDGSGNILVTITRTGGAAYTYLNAVVIEEVDASVILLNPQHLHAEPVDKTSIALTWTDRTNNEQATGGYELQRATDSLFTANVTNIPLAANTTEYTDQGLKANTKYWYRVRAKNGADVSEYSNKYNAVTPESIVYINFNSTLPDGPFPWNNINASSLSEFVIDDLYNQSGELSGLGFGVTKVFNGEFTAGANTGNNSGVVPDNVLASNFWLDNGQLSQVKITGLNHTRRYRIGFVGSSSTPGWFKGNYTATYTVNGRTVYLNSWMNSSKAVYISDIVPDANGEIYLDFSTTADAQWSFTAAVIVEEYIDATGGSVPYQSNSLLDSTTDVAAMAVDKYRIRIYPNPFSDVINLDFNNPSGGRVSADVYDINGRLVHRQEYGAVPAGMNTLKIGAIRTANNGLYFVALKIDGKVVQVTKMLRRK
jgi:fibronectin type 3 domain-containing protein